MNESPASIAGQPWYREVWPWLLMLPPALSVVGGVTMVVLATQTPSALVVEDYARIEELTGERFDQDRLASLLALTAEFRFDRDAGRVDVSLSGADYFETPETLTLFLRHTTNPANDIELSLAGDGERFSAGAEVAPGRYYLELMPEDRVWRLGSDARRLEGRIVLSPQPDGA